MRYSKAELEQIRRQMGQRIAELRRAHNPPWTQFDLAAASGCRPEAISRIERGAVDFGVSNVFKIASALAIAPETLIAAGSGAINRSRYPDHTLTLASVHERTAKSGRRAK